METWRYFPEESVNLLNFFTIKLFVDGSEIMRQEVCLNWKFVADFWRSNAVFREKMQILNFVLTAKGLKPSRQVWG
jgi:hypothetical protein